MSPAEQPHWRDSEPQERAVAQALTDLEWTVTVFGRSVFSDEFNKALNDTPINTPVRFLPDLLATRDGTVIAVEVKGSTQPNSGNYAIAEPALEYFHDFCCTMGIIGYVVWHDNKVSTSDWLVSLDGQQARKHNDAEVDKRTPYFLYAQPWTVVGDLEEIQ